MEKFDKLESKIDKLDERLDVIDKHLAVYNSQLEYHIARTNLLEDSLKNLKDDLKPVEIHVTRVNAIIKFLLFVSGIAGLIKLFSN